MTIFVFGFGVDVWVPDGTLVCELPWGSVDVVGGSVDETGAMVAASVVGAIVAGAAAEVIAVVCKDAGVDCNGAPVVARARAVACKDGCVVCNGAALVAIYGFAAVPNITLSADAGDAEFGAGGGGGGGGGTLTLGETAAVPA